VSYGSYGRERTQWRKAVGEKKLWLHNMGVDENHAGSHREKAGDISGSRESAGGEQLFEVLGKISHLSVPKGFLHHWGP